MPRRNNGAHWDRDTQSYAIPSRTKKRRKVKKKKHLQDQRQATENE
jgi:hypothetical protein